MKLKKRKWLIEIFFFCFIPLCLFIVSTDDSAPDVSDLQIHFRQIPDDQNACTYFLKASKFFGINDLTTSQPTTNESETSDERLDDLYKKEDWPIEEIQSILTENKKFITICEQGLKCPDLVIPEIQDITSESPLINSVRYYMKLKILEASAQFQEHHDEAAFNQLIKILDLGQRIQNGQGNIYYYLIADSIKSQSLCQIPKYLATTSLSSKQLRAYNNQLENYYETPNSWTTVLKYEYKIMSQEVNTLFQKKLWQRFFHKFQYMHLPNNTNHRLAKYCRIYIKDEHKNFSDRTIVKSDLPTKTWQQVLTRNIMGKLLVDTSLTSYDHFLANKSKASTTLSATRCLIALKCYKLDHGELPKSLDDLIPNYLSELPIDDFDGKTLRYNPEKKIIYSIGKDLIDNDGRALDPYKDLPYNKPYDLPYDIKF